MNPPLATGCNPHVDTVSPASAWYVEFQGPATTERHTITLQVICIPRESA